MNVQSSGAALAVAPEVSAPVAAHDELRVGPVRVGRHAALAAWKVSSWLVSDGGADCGVDVSRWPAVEQWLPADAALDLLPDDGAAPIPDEVILDVARTMGCTLSELTERMRVLGLDRLGGRGLVLPPGPHEVRDPSAAVVTVSAAEVVETARALRLTVEETLVWVRADGGQAVDPRHVLPLVRPGDWLV